MKSYRKVHKEVVELVSIHCNKCGNELDSQLGDGISINHVWGFGSKKDYQRHQLDICEKCYDEWVKTFKIRPEVDVFHDLI